MNPKTVNPPIEQKPIRYVQILKLEDRIIKNKNGG